MPCCNYTATESFQIISFTLIHLRDELFPFLLFSPRPAASEEKAERTSKVSCKGRKGHALALHLRSSLPAWGETQHDTPEPWQMLAVGHFSWLVLHLQHHSPLQPAPGTDECASWTLLCDAHCTRTYLLHIETLRINARMLLS